MFISRLDYKHEVEDLKNQIANLRGELTEVVETCNQRVNELEVKSPVTDVDGELCRKIHELEAENAALKNDIARRKVNALFAALKPHELEDMVIAELQTEVKYYREALTVIFAQVEDYQTADEQAVKQFASLALSRHAAQGELDDQGKKEARRI